MSRAQLHSCLHQFAIHQAYVAYWQTMILSGAAAKRNMQKGREPTAEERASGQVIGWRDQTDDEKVAAALATMGRHIDAMHECQKTAYNLLKAEEANSDSVGGSYDPEWYFR